MFVSPPVDPVAPAPAAAQTPRRRGWTTGRIVSTVAGGIVGVAALGVLAVGGWGTWATNTQRDADGYLTSSSHTIAATGQVITSREVGELAGRTWGGLVGVVRIRATPTEPDTGVFIGVAPSGAVDRYLAGAGRTSVTGWFPVATQDVTAAGGSPTTAPPQSRIWTAHVSGSGAQALSWRPAPGTTVVIMRPDGSPGFSAAIDVGATVPDLAWLAAVCFVVGAAMLGAAGALIAVPLRRSRH